MLNPKAPPFWPTPKVPTRVAAYEPGFLELLQKPKPLNPHYMPPNRPKKITSYLERDGEYYHEVSKLQNSIILYTASLNFQLGVDKVTEYAAETGLVNVKEVHIGKMSKARVVIFLPEGLAPETFIEATPQHLWDMGLSFQRWNQLEDGELHNPTYKVLMDIVGFPPPIYREKAIIRAVSRFGLYLGSVTQQHQGDIAEWTVVVGVKELEEVPDMASLVVGGIEYEAEVHVQMWSTGPVFKKEDMPKPPDKINGPKPKVIVQAQTIEAGQSSVVQDPAGDNIRISRSALEEICEDKDIEIIPLELRRFLLGGPSGVANNVTVQNLAEAQETTQNRATENQNEVQNELQQVLHESSMARRLQRSLAALHDLVNQPQAQLDQNVLQPTFRVEEENNITQESRMHEAGNTKEELRPTIQQTTELKPSQTHMHSRMDKESENEERNAQFSSPRQTVNPLFSSPNSAETGLAGEKGLSDLSEALITPQTRAMVALAPTHSHLRVL